MKISAQNLACCVPSARYTVHVVFLAPGTQCIHVSTHKLKLPEDTDTYKAETAPAILCQSTTRGCSVAVTVS